MTNKWEPYKCSSRSPGARATERGGVHRQLVQDRRSQHEVNDFGRLAVEDLVQEIPGHRVAVELYAAGLQMAAISIAGSPDP